MAYHEARKVKEKMDDEERRAIAEADAMSLAADQADQADQADASPSEAAE
jgi:DNA-directed RNA polymerase subunit beta'